MGNCKTLPLKNWTRYPERQFDGELWQSELTRRRNNGLLTITETMTTELLIGQYFIHTR